MEYWKENHFTVNWKNLPMEIKENGEWEQIKSADFSQIEYLIIWHHKSSDKTFENLPHAPKLKYLEINWSGSTSLLGLEKYGNLKRLELQHCSKLKYIENICNLKNHIEYIHINMSKNINDHAQIICCKKLTTLCFNNCGTIADLIFLEKLNKLEDFRFVKSNILNGDLTPIIEHPSITKTGFMNKRHYSHKDSEIDRLLSEKVPTSAAGFSERTTAMMLHCQGFKFMSR